MPFRDTTCQTTYICCWYILHCIRWQGQSKLLQAEGHNLCGRSAAQRQPSQLTLQAGSSRWLAMQTGIVAQLTRTTNSCDAYVAGFCTLAFCSHILFVHQPGPQCAVHGLQAAAASQHDLSAHYSHTSCAACNDTVIGCPSDTYICLVRTRQSSSPLSLGNCHQELGSLPKCKQGTSCRVGTPWSGVWKWCTPVQATYLLYGPCAGQACTHLVEVNIVLSTTGVCTC
jgi:hypothetical protein